MEMGYYKLVKLDGLTKQEYDINAPHRLDCTHFHVKPNDGRGIDKLKKKSGKHQNMLYGYLSDPFNNKGDYSFIINGINLSTIMYVCDNCNRGFGTPPPDNPEFREYRNDGYLFTFNANYSVVELLVIPNGKHSIASYYGQFLDGEFDKELEEHRTSAVTFYPYNTSQLTLL